MSRVAKNPIEIPENVVFNVNDDVVTVKGNKGELDFILPEYPNLKLLIISSLNPLWCK